MKRFLIDKASRALALVFALVPCRSLVADEKKTVEIPLSKIYSTSIQQETEPFAKGVTARQGELISKIKEKSAHAGASNIYLVCGKNLDDALNNTGFQLETAVPLNRPIHFDPNAKRPRQLWMVAYFGVTSSSPAQWQIKSIQVRDKVIRIVFREDGGGGTDDLHPYYFWIPLGELEKGRYTLELFDEKRNEAVLMRRVEVTEP